MVSIEYIYIYIYATPLFRTYEFHKTVGVWGPWSIHYKWKYIYIYIYIYYERERERERERLLVLLEVQERHAVLTCSSLDF